MILGKTVGVCGIPETGRPGSHVNTGNFLHGYAARAVLSDHVNVSYMNTSEEQRDELRNRLSHLAYVAATTISVNREARFAKNHEVLADFIESLGLPVIVFGLGAQAPLGQSVKDAEVNPHTRRLLSVLSAHAPSIAVRGEFTADLCRHMGIDNVEVIGCQSCFVSMTSEFRFPEPAPTIRPERTVVNFTRYGIERKLLHRSMEEGSTFIGQSSHFEYRLKSEPEPVSFEALPPELDEILPRDLRRLFETGQIPFERFQHWIRENFHQFYNMEEWFTALRGNFDLSIGTRFHGNMAALQAGIPALWIVHDSRTQEFCNLLGLPQAPLEELRAGASVRDLVEAHLDGSTFDSVYPRNYARFHAYLERHGVAHRLAAPSPNHAAG